MDENTPDTATGPADLAPDAADLGGADNLTEAAGRVREAAAGLPFFPAGLRGAVMPAVEWIEAAALEIAALRAQVAVLVARQAQPAEAADPAAGEG